MGDTEEAFRASGMGCSGEVAVIGRAVKPLAGVVESPKSIVASNGTIYHDGSVKQRNLAVAVNSSGVEVESGSQEKGHRQILRKIKPGVLLHARAVPISLPNR